jgi:hypothetical protein
VLEAQRVSVVSVLAQDPRGAVEVLVAGAQVEIESQLLVDAQRAVAVHAGAADAEVEGLRGHGAALRARQVQIERHDDPRAHTTIVRDLLRHARTIR